MRKLKSAKILFCLAALLFVAKPFLGFTIFNRTYQPVQESIFVKSFTKRKLEYAENSSFNMDAVQKKLAKPVKQFFLLFWLLLGVIFPVVFCAGASINNGFLRKLQFSLPATGHLYLYNGKLII